MKKILKNFLNLDSKTTLIFVEINIFELIFYYYLLLIREAVSKPKPKTEDKNKASADGKKKPIFTNSKMGDEKKVFKPINIINDDNVESLLENKIKFEDRKFKIEGKKDEKVAKPLELTEQQVKKTI